VRHVQEEDSAQNLKSEDKEKGKKESRGYAQVVNRPQFGARRSGAQDRAAEAGIAFRAIANRPFVR